MTATSPPDLLEFSRIHLAYEIDMCQWAAKLLVAFAPERHNLVNVLVESYALHIRNLIEFLYWEPRGDDVNAIHYVRSKTAWSTALGEAPEFLLEVKKRADKQVAHLTTKRYTEGPKKEWRPLKEIAMLLPFLRLFLERADNERLHSNVPMVIDRMASLIPVNDEED